MHPRRLPPNAKDSVTAQADAFVRCGEPPVYPCLQGVVDRRPGGRGRNQRANPMRRERYRGPLPDAARDHGVAAGQHFHEGGVVSTGCRPARPRYPRAGHAGFHFYHYEGRGARQMIANGNAVRSSNPNPSDLHSLSL